MPYTLVCKKDVPKRLLVSHSEWSQRLMTVEHRSHPHPRTGLHRQDWHSWEVPRGFYSTSATPALCFYQDDGTYQAMKRDVCQGFYTNKGFIPRWVNCTYREKQNSSCFLKHSLMSSVDTVELPSPERDHIHHQLPLSWQQDQARTHLIQEWIPLGKTKRKSSCKMLEDPQITSSQNDSDPPFWPHVEAILEFLGYTWTCQSSNLATPHLEQLQGGYRHWQQHLNFNTHQTLHRFGIPDLQLPGQFHLLTPHQLLCHSLWLHRMGNTSLHTACSCPLRSLCYLPKEHTDSRKTVSLSVFPTWKILATNIKTVKKAAPERV